MPIYEDIDGKSPFKVGERVMCRDNYSNPAAPQIGSVLTVREISHQMGRDWLFFTERPNDPSPWNIRMFTKYKPSNEERMRRRRECFRSVTK